jgi:hypothetical protein
MASWFSRSESMRSVVTRGTCIIIVYGNNACTEDDLGIKKNAVYNVITCISRILTYSEHVL